MPPANPAAVVVDVPGPGSVLGNGVFGVDAVSRDARTPGVQHDKNDPRLWDTMNHPAAVASRSAAFAFSSKGLPRKYDYRDWSSTTFILRDRAVSNFIWPLCLCVGVALGWSVLYFTVEPLRHDRYDLSEFSTMFGLVFTALGFMLVFRLSRAAIRFWDCRTAWGTIAMRGRALMDDVIVSLGPHAPKECDEIIRWFCALAVGAKCHLRCSSLSAEQLTGILTTHEVEDMTSRMTSRYHMFCANKVRSAIAKALLLENGGEGNEADERDASAFVTNVDSRRPFRKNIHPQHAAILMHSMRNHLDVVVDQAGAMERIKATRLPIVYVAHLRTFLLVYVLSMPFVYVSTWGWGVVPATGAIAFALLGIEGAATECENPFSAKRTNHLGMDGFCENIIGDTSAMLEWWREEVVSGVGWGGRESVRGTNGE